MYNSYELYRTIGVSIVAEPSEIEAAYHRRKQAFERASRFKKIVLVLSGKSTKRARDAYLILSDQVLKKEYDERCKDRDCIIMSL